ncbi:MAG TPA: radical SAM family heme chaperone HemW [Gemmatimonadales bacterium]|nr:radical SAM family heme chaperone HemW [Gemmatimonadales bacterium]
MHLYVHVPFCARRCSYCDFAIAVRREVPSDAYAAAVGREWRTWQHHPAWNEDPVVRTLYFGGGTPSHLAPAAIARLVETVARDRAIAPDAEITLEANPDDVTAEAARAWREAGINRVSLGVQSFDPRVLAWMHRVHTAEQVPAAVETLRAAGIAELSLDLIFGLPEALGRDWAADLAQALALAPDHLSMYGLTVEPHTPLGRWVQRREVAPVGDDRYAAEFLETHRTLEAHGFEHYEVSNAARPGRRARHNSAYWRRAAYIGLGPSAHSGHGTERSWNLRDWTAYERAIRAGDPTTAAREVLDAEAIRLEELYLGLRTMDGLPADRLAAPIRGAWIGAGWAEEREGRLRLTPEGWLRLDALVAAAA